MRKKISKLLALMLALCCVLTACGPQTVTPGPGSQNPGTENPSGSEEDPVLKLEYAPGTVLRMATGYQKPIEGIAFVAETVGEGLKLSNGKTYYEGDLKPTWEEMQNRINVKFESKWTGAGSAEKEFTYWREKLNEVDMVAGSVSILAEAGAAGEVVNLAEYLDYMPHFKAFLEANPIVRLSITGSVTGDNKGAIYFSPYFDGVDDIERMPLMRTDWVEKLLNGEGKFTAEACGNLNAAVYEPYMPTSGKVAVDVASKDGSKVETINKDYDTAGNIVKTMNDALAKGTVTGVEAVNMLRDYIDKAYNGYYGTNRADLFIGQNAAWDADELVALLRCVVSNAKTLNGKDSVEGLFSREDANNQRRVDMFRFAGTLFGVRGLESRQDYLYVGTDGKLHDARQEADTYVALERMNAMAQEGLISSTFINGTDTKTEKMLADDAGFMHYDYNQTQTIYNETKLDSANGEKYAAVLVPVARWYDGTNKDGVYMRFTESWRSVKTDGWAISKAGVEGSQDKLHAALALIDYAYTEAGQILLSYGPDEFIKKDASGNYVTFNFNGKQMPVMAETAYQELWDLMGGNYTNYGRRILGSTYSFVKLQSFEYQCTQTVGKEGAARLSTAIALGLIKHPALAITENPWYSIVPTTLPTTKAENEIIGGFAELASKGKFSSSKGDSNILVDIIAKGYAGAELVDGTTTANTVANEWNGKSYLQIKQDAYTRLINFYNELSK